MVVDDTSICFVNCHLAASQHHVRACSDDAAKMLEDQTLNAETAGTEEVVAWVNGGDGSMVLDHEVVFVSALRAAPSPECVR